MANNTIYPYGTGGQAPSGIPIIDDLTTGGADKALSAKQGVVLNDRLTPIESALVGTVANLTSEISSCGASIRNADNIWASISGYYGALISITDWRGNKVRITPNSSYAATYTFLKSGVSVGNVADFATGYSGLVETSVAVDVVVPPDAVYLYVYMVSNTTTFTPQSVEVLGIEALKPSDVIDDLTTGGTDKVLSAEQGKNLNTRLVSVEGNLLCMLDDITDNIVSCGATINNSNKWQTNATYYGALVSVSTWRGRYVRIVPNSQRGYTYTFLKSGVSNGNTPDYATGYTNTRGSSTAAFYKVPDDAVYLYVYMQSTSSTIYTPSKLERWGYVGEVVPGMVDGAGITVMSYNIGHFSNGVHTSSDITSSTYAQKVDAFRALLSNKSPDIYGIVEYSAVFGKNTNNVNVNTKDELFGLATTVFESTQLHYACYALFANRVPIYNVKINDFDCLANETITHTSLVEAQDYRYISADLYALGKSIKLIVTHLAFDNNRPNVLQASEMSELYTKFASYPYVIMMGDFNYKAYVMAPDAEAAGYKLANDDSFKTYPNDNLALDNILVKGLNFAWVKMISSNLSDHNPILARITL